MAASCSACCGPGGWFATSGFRRAVARGFEGRVGHRSAGAVLTACGDLIRCAGADGRVHWRYRPCAPDEGSKRSVAPTSTLCAAASRLCAAVSRCRGHAACRRPAVPRVLFASIGEAALAVCSERFLAYAHQDRARMDACMAANPRCAARSTACCPDHCAATCARAERALRHPMRSTLRCWRRTQGLRTTHTLNVRDMCMGRGEYSITGFCSSPNRVQLPGSPQSALVQATFKAPASASCIADRRSNAVSACSHRVTASSTRA